ncbi:MAG: acyltransferase family protein [Bacteroidota bacterium]
MNRGKLLYLEGVRGIAALIVVLSHFQFTFSPTFPDHLLILLKEQLNLPLVPHGIHAFVIVFLDGNLAVFIFWFMSAYVISIRLFTEGNQDYLYKSITKRYFRLMIPALGSIFLAYSLLSLGLMFNQELAIEGGLEINKWLNNLYNFDPSLFMSLKSGIWDAFFDYNELSSYNAALWTMYPELMGSLFVFGLFAAVGNRRKRDLIYLAIFLIVVFLKTYWLASFVLGYWYSDVNNAKD